MRSPRGRLIDDLTSVGGHGRAVLAVWSGFAEQDGGSARDAAWMPGVNRRIRALAIAVAARETGAA
ncbi:hypothetical protein OG800_16250 [Streptomyces sp. NBC_00445]|uniref:hypothetical protein n=1 Tax=Streptomyces sp. NBC_00445 TaxID=2975745 RepID=UPI002E209F6E